MIQVVLARQGPSERFVGAIEVMKIAQGVLGAERALALFARGFGAGSEFGATEVYASARARE